MTSSNPAQGYLDFFVNGASLNDTNQTLTAGTAMHAMVCSSNSVFGLEEGLGYSARAGNGHFFTYTNSGLGTVTGSIDSDGDHIPDYQEAHVYHTRPDDPDSDDDGQEDGEEVEMGTNPNDSNELFEVANTSLTNGNFCISFSSASGITYNVMYCPDLMNGDWQLQETITGSGNMEHYLTPMTNKAGFFRVDAEVNFE